MGTIFNPLTGQIDFTGSGSGGSGVAVRYVHTFNATTDWGSPSGGYYTLTVSAVTHGLGTTPISEVFEIIGSDLQKVNVSIEMNSFGDVSISVLSSPDLRFSGKLLLI